ncbi:DNA polymerase-1 [Actinopolymorpha cephalotaxi]|uniref:DNA-directed DNA polymerase n=1 Tax=Actinopolymorpha cephalotaxi TaxID=504797 RepID=A0A1I2MY29_9ACTN|nr:DNA polymerase [Actinopolymorpha cephalotaxi]NYH85873.1 DNA polymerase-1 [Actinopolymorpha cephalotaxi]SFF94031.1 DNA polymerase-1 [Actinopolymorpha cephalotaxi]
MEPWSTAEHAPTLAGLAELVGSAPGRCLALVVVPGLGVGLAVDGHRRAVRCADPAGLVAELDRELRPRWVWWDARTTAGQLLAADVRVRACWDLAAGHRVLHGGRRDDPAAVWAAATGLPEPPPPRREVTLLDWSEPATLPGALSNSLGGSDAANPAVSSDANPAAGSDANPAAGSDDESADFFAHDGRLRPDVAGQDWLADRVTGPAADAVLDRAARWAALALRVRAAQDAGLRALPDPRASPRSLPLAVLTAYAESAAALLAVELEHDGLPLDRGAAERYISGFVGPRPATPAAEAAARARRDAAVVDLFRPGSGEEAGVRVDLRNPVQVRELLGRVGFNLPDTRSWRLEPFRDSHPGVAAFLDWRKAERIATTYGYGWLDRHVGADGRLRGTWAASDGAAGRMTAGAGLHNLPAGLRVAVAAEPGHVLVRADLGQIEPRVLAVVSGDAALARAARADDLYAPVAAQLHCDRPTAKVAVLAAMYGQTSGTAGAALRRMERAYPRAIGYLRTAEEAGLVGRDIRTHGGRLIRLRPGESDASDAAEEPVDPRAADAPPGSRPAADRARRHGHGRFARNAVVQGAAAEFFKAWAAAVRTGLRPFGGRIVLCLHDELLLHVPAEHAGDATALLASALESTAGFWAAGSSVRFVADVSVVTRWSEAK